MHSLLYVFITDRLGSDWIKSYVQIGPGGAAPARTGINPPEQPLSAAPILPSISQFQPSLFHNPWLLPSAVLPEMLAMPSRCHGQKEGSQQGWQSRVRASSSAEHPSSLENSPSKVSAGICSFLTLNLSEIVWLRQRRRRSLSVMSE